MATRLRRGSKAEPERIALSLRDEMGLAPDDRLDCRDLARHLGIPIAQIRELAGDAPDPSITRLLSKDAGFSALTVCAGTRRLIVYNQRTPPGRRGSWRAHELARIILEHLPVAAVGANGRRLWDDERESAGSNGPRDQPEGTAKAGGAAGGTTGLDPSSNRKQRAMRPDSTS